MNFIFFNLIGLGFVVFDLWELDIYGYDFFFYLSNVFFVFVGIEDVE